MAQCKLTPHEFIQNAFSPMVAVMCSSLVDHTCQKNNLSFIEMIQPFCKLNTEAHFREPSGTLVTVRNLRITMLDVNSRPPQPTLARKFLNESVSMSWNERNTSLQIGGQTIEVPASVPWFEAWRETFLQVQFPSDHEFTKHYIACILVVSSAENNPTDTLQHMEAQLQQLQTVTPAKLPKWFCPKVLRYYVLLHDAIEGDGAKAENTLGTMKQVYGDNLCFFLQTNSRPPGQNEDHSHLPDPWSQFLTRQLDAQDGSDQESSPRTPAEMGGVTGMPSHVMTDGSIDGDVARPPNMGPIVMSALEVAQEAGENATPVVVTHHPLSPDTEHHNKNNYGNDVTSIPSHINANVWVGQSTTATLQHGAHLTASDLDRLRMLVQEFCIKALLPYVERQIQQLSDIISNKKGVSRSLFSATKRWFGSNKPGTPGSNAPLNAVIYSSDAPELQMRRLGDLCFMFGHYSLAFQAYHSAKRDFNADQAWLYYAGALEMAALSAFMQGEVTRKAQEYMDEAIVTYLNSCKMQQFATRATLLSTECLKGRSLYGEAAKQFIRMTSEDSDLRSALLLEQASYCFLKATRPRMLRKYAFHIVLAGHRFSKASQRRHSLRCYRQAYQVYENKNWSLAEDHIHFTIGRQAANLKQISEAAQAFAKLLTPASRQSATQQAAFLREFLVTQQQLIGEEGQSSLPVLPLPLIDGDSIQVLMGDLPFHPYSDGPSPVVPATGISFSKDSTLDADSRWGKLEELLVAEAQGSLPMIFKPTVQLYNNETNNTSKPLGIVKEPVTLSLMLQNPLHIPLPLGNLRLLWRFTENGKQEAISNETAEPANSPIETQCLESLLLNAHSTREVILKVTPQKIGELDVLGLAYDIANPNDPAATVPGKQVFRIRATRPRPSKSRTIHELQDRRLELSIVKPAPCLQVLFRDLCSEMLCGEIRHIGLEFCNSGSTALTSLYVASLNPELYSLGEPSKVTNVTRIALPGGQLSPGQIHSFPMWLRAPDSKGPANLDMLFYYENSDSSSIPRYRLVRHSWQLSVLSSVQLSSTASRSSRAQEEVLNLKLCIKNCSQVHDPWMAEIYLLQVSLVGHKWRLSQDVVVPPDVKLQAQELVHFLAKVQRHQGQNSEERIFSDVVIAQQHEAAGLKRTSPYIDFFHRYQQSISDPSKPETEVENTAKRMETALKLDAILVVRWRASVTAGDGKKWAALGQSHLLLDQVGTAVTWPLPPEPALHQEPLQGPLQIFGREDSSPTSQPYVSLDVLQKLVTYTIMHSPCIKHDFKCSRLCVVPVQLVLRNCCDNQLVVRVNSISNNSSVSVSNKNQLYSPHPSSAFRWVGLAETWMELEPHESATVHLSAAVGSPGTYNLGNRLEVLCRGPDAPETDAVAQSWRIESSLIVISSIKS